MKIFILDAVIIYLLCLYVTDQCIFNVINSSRLITSTGEWQIFILCEWIFVFICILLRIIFNQKFAWSLIYILQSEKFSPTINAKIKFLTEKDTCKELNCPPRNKIISTVCPMLRIFRRGTSKVRITRAAPAGGY